MKVSKAEFAAIKSKTAARKAKRTEKAAQNMALSLAVGKPAAAGCAKTASAVPDAPKRLKRRIERIRPISRDAKTKAIKKRILGPGGLWSTVVRARDKRCVMCNKTETLQAHHWLFRRAHSSALAVDPSNGITLCYGCHIGRVHQDGDGDFILQIAARMEAKLPPGEVARMREAAKHPQPLSLEWWQDAEQRLRYRINE